MKKKIFATLVLFASMAITACGGAGASQNAGTSEPHKHSYGEWTQVKAPTCEEKGQEERVCACGDKQTRDVKELGHKWNDGAITKEATCSVPGEKTFTCTVCGATKKEVITAEHDLQAFAHDQGEGEVAETIKKCSKDAYYQIEFKADDAAATLNNTSDKKSGYVKLSKQVAADGTGTASYIEWKIWSPAALKGRFWIDITGNTSNVWTREDKSNAQSLYYTYNDTTTNINTWKNKVELNGVEVDFENATYKIGEEDVKFAELTYSDFGELASSSGATISVPMPEVNLVEGVNTLRFTRLTGYAFNMHSFTFKTSL